MAELVTLIAQLDDIDPSTESGLLSAGRLRPCARTDVQSLGRLYFEAYDTGVACDTVEEAVADIEASFAGAYGEFWFEASPVVAIDGEIVSAVMAVHRTPWDDTPDCAFIIELFTARTHRRDRMARTVMQACMSTLKTAGETAVALRVDQDNTPAVALYESLGFALWTAST